MRGLIEMRFAEECDRLTGRREVLLQARCRKSAWKVYAVELADLSAGGCCIVGSSEAYATGDELTLRFAHLKPLKAHVRWVREDRVGVEFRIALDGRVIDELAQVYGLPVLAAWQMTA